MAQEFINIGNGRNNSGGDPDRAAFEKINRMFTELYGAQAVTENAIRTARVSYAITARTQLRSGTLFEGTVFEDTMVNTVFCSVSDGSTAGPVVIELRKNSVTVGTITIPQDEKIGEIVWAAGDHHLFQQHDVVEYYVADTGTPRAKGLIISAR